MHWGSRLNLGQGGRDLRGSRINGITVPFFAVKAHNSLIVKDCILGLTSPDHQTAEAACTSTGGKWFNLTKSCFKASTDRDRRNHTSAMSSCESKAPSCFRGRLAFVQESIQKSLLAFVGVNFDSKTYRISDRMNNSARSAKCLGLRIARKSAKIKKIGCGGRHQYLCEYLAGKKQSSFELFCTGNV